MICHCNAGLPCKLGTHVKCRLDLPFVRRFAIAKSWLTPQELFCKSRLVNVRTPHILHKSHRCKQLGFFRNFKICSTNLFEFSKLGLCLLIEPPFPLCGSPFIFAFSRSQNSISITNQILRIRPILIPPGSIVSSGGDIDNRLKTLLDALKMPKEPNEIPRDDTPETDENPFYCLLEDDGLITKLSIDTAQLLEKSEDRTFVNALVHVRTKVTRLSWANMGLG